jgi:hypothetical protein
MPEGFKLELIPPTERETRQHTVHYQIIVDAKIDVVLPAEVDAKEEMRHGMLDMAATQLARNAIELLRRYIS